jgi:hypothetical protein|tara:strand:- start:89 stop:322 length:234 start_codon:yes stop_codon:yes gene_type:complete
MSGVTLVCQFTENMEDHWWCSGSYVVDMNADNKEHELCECKCHDKDYQLSFLIDKKPIYYGTAAQVLHQMGQFRRRA